MSGVAWESSKVITPSHAQKNTIFRQSKVPPGEGRFQGKTWNFFVMYYVAGIEKHFPNSSLLIHPFPLSHHSQHHKTSLEDSRGRSSLALEAIKLRQILIGYKNHNEACYTPVTFDHVAGPLGGRVNKCCVSQEHLRRNPFGCPRRKGNEQTCAGTSIVVSGVACMVGSFVVLRRHFD